MKVRGKGGTLRASTQDMPECSLTTSWNCVGKRALVQGPHGQQVMPVTQNIQEVTAKRTSKTPSTSSSPQPCSDPERPRSRERSDG